MIKNNNKIITELISHPGETILEVIVERNISRDELTIKTGFSEDYVLRVINGEDSISKEFAEELEKVLGVSASFWNNLQKNYDLEIKVLDRK